MVCFFAPPFLLECMVDSEHFDLLNRDEGDLAQSFLQGVVHQRVMAHIPILCLKELRLRIVCEEDTDISIVTQRIDELFLNAFHFFLLL